MNRPGDNKRRGNSRPERLVVAGTISSAAFSSGHRFVVGHWPRSPIGPMSDLMWADPHDHRTLIAPTKSIAEFVTAIYDFDSVRVAPLVINCDRQSTTVSGSGLDLELIGGRRWPLPARRPLAMTRFVEAPIARLVMGVQTYGTSPTGYREWYQSTGWRWITKASGTLNNRDLGSLQEFDIPVGVGFSEPPRKPSIVNVRVTIEPNLRAASMSTE